MSTQTSNSNHCIAFSERDWPSESLRGMYYHSACTNCGKEYIGPKGEIFCFICSNSKKHVDNETGNL